MAVLRARDGTVHRLLARAISIGSTAKDDIRVAGADEAAAVVVPDRDGGHGVRAGSIKVLLNGARVKSHALADGDRLTVGDDELVYLERSPDAAGPVAAPALERAARALNDIASAAREGVPEQRLLERLARAAAELCGADASLVVLADPREMRAVAFGQGLAEASMEPRTLLSDTLVRQAIEKRQSRVIDDVRAHPEATRATSLAAMTARSVLLAPFRVGDEVDGVLLAAARGAGRFGSEHLALAELVAGHVALLLRPGRAAASALRELTALREKAADSPLLGASRAIVDIAAHIERVAKSDLSVLVVGETGTGKEVVARALHQQSGRSAGPFVAVNCGAVPRDLIESELFGHVKGAFTGAHGDRPGLFELASPGTLFLDEIGQMPSEQQVRLLRVLEERVVTRVGDSSPRPVDVRVVAATQNAADPEHGGTLRRDLLFRLDEVRIELPPLRDRGDDVLLLAERFLAHSGAKARLSSAARAALARHDWPGNVRELKGRVRRATVLCEGGLIDPADLGLPGPKAAGPASVTPFKEASRAFSRRHVEAAIAACGGDRRAAAAALGIGLRSLYRHLEER